MFQVPPARTHTPTHPVLVGTTPALNRECYTCGFIACLFSSGHKDGFLLTPPCWRCWVESCAPSKLQPSHSPPTLHVVWGLWWVFSFLLRSQLSTTLVQNTGPLGHELACQTYPGTWIFPGLPIINRCSSGDPPRDPPPRLMSLVRLCCAAELQQ